MAKNINPKMAFGHLFNSVSQRIKDYREELESELAFGPITREAFKARDKKISRLDHDEATLRYLEELFNARKRARNDGRKPETGSRLLKVSCPECGYVMRVTFIHIANAVPICPDSNCENFRKDMDYELPHAQGDKDYNENMARAYSEKRYVPELRELTKEQKKISPEIVLENDNGFDPAASDWDAPYKPKT